MQFLFNHFSFHSWAVLAIFLTLTPHSALVAQDYTAIDDKARDYRFTREYRQAAQDLAAPYDNPTHQARAIFAWIAHNIDYDPKPLDAFMETGKRTGTTFNANSREELEAKKAEYVEERIETALKQRKGVCMEYAWLFEAMCREIGIPAEFISGLGRGSYQNTGGRPQRYYHAWNAVYLDNAWKLVDVTWSVDMGKGKRFDTGYFLTDPYLFLHNHFPDSSRWQLVEQPVSEEEYFALPYLHRNFVELGGVKVSPETAVIPLRRMPDIELEFNTPIETEFLVIVGDKPKRIGVTREGLKYTIRYDPEKSVPHLVTIGLLREGGKVDGLVTYRAK